MEKDLEKILDEQVCPKRPEGYGITIAEFAKKKDLPLDTARNIVNRLESAGILKREKMREYRKIIYVYTKAK